MPHQIINSDTSLIIGSDALKHIKREVPATYMETESTSSQTTGSFQSGNVLRWDWFNSNKNAVAVSTILHMNIANTGANPILLVGIASLIAKCIVYANNVEVLRINSPDNCQFLEQLGEIRRAKTDFGLQRIKNSKQGRTAGSANFHQTINNGANADFTCDLNDLFNDLFLGIDSSKVSKWTVEITWRTDSTAPGITKFMRNTAANTNLYGDLDFTNSFIRNKYIILPDKYITKNPVSKELKLVEKQVVTFASGTEKIIKLDDVFSNRKKASAVLVVCRNALTAFNDADAMKTGIPYSLKYTVNIGGRQVKKRDTPSDALAGCHNWVESENGVQIDSGDSVFDNFYPWLSTLIPLSDIYQKYNNADKIGGINNSPMSNYELLMTITHADLNTDVELYLLYSEIATFDGKSIKIFT